MCIHVCIYIYRETEIVFQFTFRASPSQALEVSRFNPGGAAIPRGGVVRPSGQAVDAQGTSQVANFFGTRDMRFYAFWFRVYFWFTRI